jgi:DNA polymerase-4
MAKIASAYRKPKVMLWIGPGKKQQFLAPLPIKRVPGIGPKGFARLNRMGLKSISDLSLLTLELLEETYGNVAHHFTAKQWGQ